MTNQIPSNSFKFSMVMLLMCCQFSVATAGGGLTPPLDPVLTPFQSGFSDAVAIRNAGDGSNRLFVVEQGGRIKIIDNGVTLATPFLNIDPLTNGTGEQGLLGLAFHPNYAVNGYFYVYYTNN